MKIFKKITGILTAAAMVFCFNTSVFAANNTAETVNGYTYRLNQHWEDNSALYVDCDTSDNYSVISYDTQFGGAPSAILEQHKGIPITCMRGVFAHDFDGPSKDITVAPAIPKYVKDISKTFEGCEFVTPPLITDMVQNMDSSFRACKNMSSYPKPSDGVKNLDQTFMGCINASGTVLVPETVITMYATFAECSKLSSIPNIGKLKGLIRADYAFKDCKNATGGTDLPNSGLKDTSNMFYGCAKMTKPPRVIYDSTTNISTMFLQCENLSGTIDVRATLSLDKPNNYLDAFKGVASVNGAEVILNYTA